MIHESETIGDGRKYDVGDKVIFTDEHGKQSPGIVHGVRYQQGRYELVGAQRPDMHQPESPNNQPIPGTGQMELVKGTEGERHSYEYLMVHEKDHKAWHQVNTANEKHIKDDNHHLVKPLPELPQHLRIYEAD